VLLSHIAKMELRNTNIITPVGLFVSCISSSQQFIIKAQNYARRDWDHWDVYFIFELSVV
jgi:hypothetical protein